MWIFWWCAPPKVTPLSCLFFVRPTIQTSTLLKAEAAYLHILEAKIFCIKNDSNDFQISCHLIFSFQLHFYEQLLLVDNFFPSAPHIFLRVKEEVVEEWHEKKRQKYLIFVQKYGTSHLSLRTPWTWIVLFCLSVVLLTPAGQNTHSVSCYKLNFIISSIPQLIQVKITFSKQMSNNLTSQIVQDIHNTHIIVGIIQISTFNLIIKRQVDSMSSSKTTTITS